MRSTTIYLAGAHALAFFVASLFLMVFFHWSASSQLDREAEEALRAEYEQLARVYEKGGKADLNAQVVDRMTTQGQYLYLLADEDGTVITGNFDKLPEPPPESDRIDVIEFDVSQEKDGVPHRMRARAMIGRVLKGPILLVARDKGESADATARIRSAVLATGVAGVVASIILGAFAARMAASRVEKLAKSTQRVMAGDLSHRAPVTGWGDEWDMHATQINAMLDRLETLMHATRTAGDAIAHDLRTPLARLRQRLEAALSAPPDSEHDRDAIRSAQDEVDTLLRTFNAVLQISRLRSADSTRFVEVDLTALAARMADLYSPAAEDAGLMLGTRLAPDTLVRADASLLDQALANLLDNALKYTPPGGHVEVVCGPCEDGSVVLSVIDSGPGIPEADRPRVQDRFVRLEAHRQSPGSGLGLALVSAVAELHRCEFLLEDGIPSQYGRGLSATIRWSAAFEGKA